MTGRLLWYQILLIFISKMFKFCHNKNILSILNLLKLDFQPSTLWQNKNAHRRHSFGGLPFSNDRYHRRNGALRHARDILWQFKSNGSQIRCLTAVLWKLHGLRGRLRISCASLKTNKWWRQLRRYFADPGNKQPMF